MRPLRRYRCHDVSAGAVSSDRAVDGSQRGRHPDPLLLCANVWPRSRTVSSPAELPRWIKNGSKSGGSTKFLMFFIAQSDFQSHFMEPTIGIEPITPALRKRCSAGLSYVGVSRKWRYYSVVDRFPNLIPTSQRNDGRYTNNCLAINHFHC